MKNRGIAAGVLLVLLLTAGCGRGHVFENADLSASVPANESESPPLRRVPTEGLPGPHGQIEARLLLRDLYSDNVAIGKVLLHLPAEDGLTSGLDDRLMASLRDGSGPSHLLLGDALGAFPTGELEVEYHEEHDCGSGTSHFLRLNGGAVYIVPLLGVGEGGCSIRYVGGMPPPSAPGLLLSSSQAGAITTQVVGKTGRVAQSVISVAGTAIALKVSSREMNETERKLENQAAREKLGLPP